MVREVRELLASTGFDLDLRRSLVVKTPSYTGAKSDQLFMAQILIDVIGARLAPEVRRFLNLFHLHVRLFV